MDPAHLHIFHCSNYGPLSCVLALSPASLQNYAKGFYIHSSHFAAHSLSLSLSPPFTPPTSLQLSDLSRSRRRKGSQGARGGEGIAERKLVREIKQGR